MSRDPRTLALVVAGALLVAGCGGSAVTAPADSAGPSSAGPARASDLPLPDGDGSLVPTNLPDHLPDLTSTPKPTLVPPAPSKVYGADVSWPQCPKGMGIPEKRTLGAPMPTEAARFVVIGLTNGPSFTPNPCLVDQVRWVKERRLMVGAYAVVSYPSTRELRTYGGSGPFPTGTLAGKLQNTGYQAALFNIRSLRAAGLRAPFVWVDVEPVPKFEWTADTAANAAVVIGTVRGYRDAGFGVGFYSTPALWERVVGGLRVGGPEWRAAGQTSEAEALSRCGPDWTFQGGPGVLGQWVEDGRDRNVTCPGSAASLRTWFHQY